MFRARREVVLFGWRIDAQLRKHKQDFSTKTVLILFDI